MDVFCSKQTYEDISRNWKIVHVSFIRLISPFLLRVMEIYTFRLVGTEILPKSKYFPPLNVPFLLTLYKL